MTDIYHMPYGHRDVSVLIADDHGATCKFLTTLLEDRGLRVVGVAANGHEAVWLCDQFHPDIAVLDISMPVLNGFQAAAEIAIRCPTIKIIFLTGHILKEYVREALRIGGVGFVSKSQAVHDLPQAIEAALEAKKYVSGECAA